MKIIHLSDTHFGNAQPSFEIHRLKNAINGLRNLFENPDVFMIISGDITLKGDSNGYEQAERFFEETWINHGGARDRFLACPGNHDICANSFQRFDKFLYGISRNQHINFSDKSYGLVKFESVAFLMVNSSDHLDHKYGLIDLPNLKTYLQSEQEYLVSVDQRIVVVHHHFLGVHRDDTSTIRNALPFIALLDEFGFDLILHGHQHHQISLEVGKSKMKIFSARSFNYPASSLVNGINLITYSESNWSCKHLVLSDDNSMTNDLIFSKWNDK